MSLGTAEKDPNATLRYTIDWTDYLVDDTILSSEWTVTPEGVTASDPMVDEVGKVTSVWLSGGVLNRKYTITNRIKTVKGATHDETDERSFTLVIKDQ